MLRLSGSGVKGRPRIFYGWYLVVSSILMTGYLAASFFQGFQVFFLPILREFGWSRAVVGGAFSLRQMETGFLAPIVGFLVDRLGPRRVILASVVLSGSGMVLLGYIQSVWQFYAAVAMISVGASGASHGVSWATVVANWFHRLRGRALGIALLGPVFSAPFVILVALLEETVGWRDAIRLLGIGFLLIGVPLAMLARTRPQDRGLMPDGDPPPEDTGRAATQEEREDKQEEPSTEAAPPNFSAKQALKSRAFWTLVLIYGAQGIGVSGLLAHQVPYFENLGLSSAAAASTVTIMFAVSGIGRVGAGFLLDFVDWRPLLAIAMGGQALALVILANATAFWHGVVFATLLGVCLGTVIASRPVLVGQLFGMRAFGSIQGLFQGATVGAGIVGPVLLGWTFDTYGTYVPALLGVAGVTALAVGVPFLSGGRTPKTPTEA